MLTVIPLVIGWIYNRLPIVADIRRVIPRTTRQPNWNLAGYRGNLVQQILTMLERAVVMSKDNALTEFCSKRLVERG